MYPFPPPTAFPRSLQELTQGPQAKIILAELDFPQLFLDVARDHKYTLWLDAMHREAANKHIARIDNQRHLRRIEQDAMAAATLPSFVY